MSPSSVDELCATFMRCATCHLHAEARRHLLLKGCLPDPPLKVGDREWFPPRGWGGSRASGGRSVVVLSTNPGHPLPDEERIWTSFPSSPREAGGITAEQAGAQLDFVARLYAMGGRGGTSFHTRSVQVARALLWLVDASEHRPPGGSSWFDRTWFTDLVKCSTAKETGSPGIASLAERCRPHLEAELRTFKPRVIVTLGKSAREALAGAGGTTTLVAASPHPISRQWRRIDDPMWDELFAPVASGLGLRWHEVASGFAAARARLAESPRGKL